MMKKIISYIIMAFVRLWSKVYTYKSSQYLRSKRDILYSQWLKSFLGSVGVDSFLLYPVQIVGGGGKKIHIGDRTCIGSNCILGCWERYSDGSIFQPEIQIGDDCNIGDYCQMTAINKIIIGNGLLTGRFVYIGDNSHGGLSVEEANIPPIKRKLMSKGDIIIGKNVWICDRVSVLGGVTIGNNVIIGAGSIVTHDIPDNCMAAGAPAKLIKRLDV